MDGEMTEIEVTEEEKAQARRDAGYPEFEAPERAPEESFEPEESSEPDHPPEDPVARLKRLYQAGEIDDEALDREIQKLAEQRAGLAGIGTPRWEQVLDAIHVGVKAGIRAYLENLDR